MVSPLAQRLEAANRIFGVGSANARINEAAMPGVLDVFEKGKMRPKGPMRMHYKPDLRKYVARWFRREVTARFPEATISYII